MKLILQNKDLQRKNIGTYILLSILLPLLFGCKTSRMTESNTPNIQQNRYLSSKVQLTIPHKDAVFTVNGTMKLISGERMQISFLMPILRTEVARIDVTPDELLLVDRMEKRYVRIDKATLKHSFSRKANFEYLEEILFKASQPGAKAILTAKELGLNKLDKAQLELTDFSELPFSMSATQITSKYTEVSLEELLELLIKLNV